MASAGGRKLCSPQTLQPTPPLLEVCVCVCYAYMCSRRGSPVHVATQFFATMMREDFGVERFEIVPISKTSRDAYDSSYTACVREIGKA